jgi:GT2 family glycosyltransferase
MGSIATLITCYNRKEKTLSCLTALFRCIVPDGCSVDVFLVDDKSNDGTSESVRKEFPQVNIIQGTGNLFWSRGMYLAWETATKTNDYDYYLWLNNDTCLYPDAIEKLVSLCVKMNNKALICSALQSAISGKVTYGGYKKKHLLVPNGKLQECETINGNCVLVSRIIYQEVGNLDYVFRHAIGDLDYGYRVGKAGFKLYITPSYLGICESNPALPKWILKDISFRKRIKALYSPLAYAEPIPFFIYERRHLGLFTAIKHFMSIHIRVLFPQLWM